MPSFLRWRKPHEFPSPDAKAPTGEEQPCREGAGSGVSGKGQSMIMFIEDAVLEHGVP